MQYYLYYTHSLLHGDLGEERLLNQIHAINFTEDYPTVTFIDYMVLARK